MTRLSNKEIKYKSIKDTLATKFPGPYFWVVTQKKVLKVKVMGTVIMISFYLEFLFSFMYK